MSYDEIRKAVDGDVGMIDLDIEGSMASSTTYYPIIRLVEGTGSLSRCAVSVVLQDFDKQLVLALVLGYETGRELWEDREMYEGGVAEVVGTTILMVRDIKPNPLLVPSKARFNMKEAIAIFEGIN